MSGSTRFGTLIAAASLAFLVSAGSASAGTINVACGDVPGLISALQAAGNGDTVKLGKQCTYTLAAPYAGIDGLPPIAIALTFDGRGSTIRRSSAAGTALFRILHVDAAGNLTLKNVTLMNGSLDNFPGQNGGGILNSGGALTMDRVTVTGNKAFQGGGVNSYGGAFTMTNSVVSNNEGTDHGGGMHLFGNATITDSEVKNNTAWILAGGILAGGPTTLTRTVVSGNIASSGGGIISYSANSPLTLIDSEVSNNTALGSGGIFSYGSTIWVVGSTISGNKATTDRGGGIQTSGTLAVFSSTFAANEAFTYGGAIDSSGLLLVSQSTLTGNKALFGGAVATSGSSTVYRTTFSGNTASQDGGAIRAGGTLGIVESTLSGNTAIFGGAVKSYGTLTIDRSTFAGNSATLGGGLAVLFSPATATIVNSTFWGNLAGTGGGVITYGDLRVLSSTVGANTATLADSAGGIEVVTFNGAAIGTLEIRNSIVATNAGANPNVGGPVTSIGHSIVGDPTGSSGWAASDATGVSNPGLAAAPASNGGPTQTVALLLGSPAIDFVPVGSCVDATGGALSVDQRSFPRVSGPACDAGAFER